VLETPEYPGVLTQFTTAVHRDQRPNTRVEVPAPLTWWTGGHGINEELVKKLFGHLVRPEAEPLQSTLPKTAKRKSNSNRTKNKSIVGPAAAGDVYAVRYREDLWGAVYCHEVQTDSRGITRGRIEYLDILLPAMPTTEQLRGRGYRDRSDGQRYQCWYSGLEKTSGVKKIATAIPAPFHNQSKPERIPFSKAADIKHLAHWNFTKLE